MGVKGLADKGSAIGFSVIEATKFEAKFISMIR